METRAEPMRRTILSESTLVPVSMVVIALSFSFWLGTLSVKVQRSEIDLSGVRAMIADLKAEIVARLDRLDGKIERLAEQRASPKR